jgi:hypothetical protein
MTPFLQKFADYITFSIGLFINNYLGRVFSVIGFEYSGFGVLSVRLSGRKTGLAFCGISPLSSRINQGARVHVG